MRAFVPDHLRGIVLVTLTLLGGVSALAAEDGGTAAGNLRQRIEQLRAGVEDVPLPVIVEALSGHHVLPWSGAARERLDAVADTVLAALRAAPIVAGRANEAGNAVETAVLGALAAQGFVAGRPAGPSGRVHAAGYPDLEARDEAAGLAFYIEVKTYSAATVDSTQRTFYLSPSADFKVTRDAVHLLIAVELEEVSSDVFLARHVRWLDLSGLRCDLKVEFNASNRDLYGIDAGLVILEAGDAVAPVP